MKNVVITGMGIVSCIGKDLQEVLKSLKVGKSGITKNTNCLLYTSDAADE